MRFVNKIHITPNKSQKETFNFWLRKCKDLYNIALEQRSESYRNYQKNISYFDQKKELPLIKQEDTSWADVPNKSLTETLKRLDNTFNRFFKNGAGYPKYKNIDTFKSIYFVSTDVRIKDGKIFLPKIKRGIKVSESVKEGYKSIILKKEIDKWYLIFSYDDNKDIVKDEINDKKLKSVGIDLGLKTLLTDSDEYEVKRFSSKLTKKYADRVSKLNQSLSKRKKGSSRRNKVKKQLSKTYLRYKNTVLDYQKKEVSKYLKHKINDEVKVIVIGNIKVSEIISKENKKSKRALRRSFSRNSLSQLKVLLNNKAESLGIKVYKVSEWNTSKTCSCCGHIEDKLKLSDRIYECTFCGTKINRDLNGSINIKAVWHGQFKPFGLDSHGIKEYRVKKGDHK